MTCNLHDKYIVPILCVQITKIIPENNLIKFYHVFIRITYFHHKQMSFTFKVFEVKTSKRFGNKATNSDGKIILIYRMYRKKKKLRNSVN